MTSKAWCRCWFACPWTHAQSKLDSPVIIGKREHRSLVLDDAGRRQGLHRADDGLKFAGAAHFSSQALGGVIHDPMPPNGERLAAAWVGRAPTLDARF